MKMLLILAAAAFAGPVEPLPELTDIRVETHKLSQVSEEARRIREDRPWHLWRIGALNLPAGGGAGVSVCAVDSGVRGKPLLKIMSGRGFVAGGDDFTGADGNGTEAAGLIASVAPEARLHVAKVTDGVKPARPAALAEAIAWCASQKVQLIHLGVSINESAASKEEVEALQRAVVLAQASGALIVTGASRHPWDRVYQVGFLPARLPGVVAVAGSTMSDQPLGDELGGAEVDFIAPGDGLLTHSGERYVTSAGSGPSAAIVTGLAALYWAKHPEASADEVVAALRRAASPIDNVVSADQGAGMINAKKLLDAR